MLLLLFGSPVPQCKAAPEVVRLWPGTAPDEPAPMGPERTRLSPALDRTQVEVTEPTLLITDVSQPTMTVRSPAPDRNTGIAVLICPGGGYWDLYWQLEGEEVAAWLNSEGITGVILKYRVPRRPGEPEREPARRPLQDAQRALRILRSRAEEWHLQPDRIGIAGFSAGGHLALATALNFRQSSYLPQDATDQLSCRPDFAISVYPGYLKDPGRDALAPGIEIPPGTPPVFLVHGGADRISSPLNSLLMYRALQAAGIPAELHLYAGAVHDFGVRRSDSPCSHWTDACIAWLHPLEKGSTRSIPSPKP
ncbi:MAG: alpha/beta hydrolase [Verrucomicrobiales bacterium]|nr:alpha/beta hydrolase [Verrucomicrobiales bacterium]